MGGAQLLHETMTRRIVVEDIGGQRQTGAGFMDGGQHGRVGLVAVSERRDPVAGGERTTGDMLHHPHQGAHPPIQFGQCRGGGRCAVGGGIDGVQPGPVLAKLGGAALDPVDAEQHVQHRPQDGHQPDQPHPADGGPFIAFVQHRVQGGHQRQQGAEDTHHQRPETAEKFTQGLKDGCEHV